MLQNMVNKSGAVAGSAQQADSPSRLQTETSTRVLLRAAHWPPKRLDLTKEQVFSGTSSQPSALSARRTSFLETPTF